MIDKIIRKFPMQSLSYEGVKIIDDKSHITSDHLVVEAPLQINVNSEPFTVVMRTPGNDIDLLRGLLYAEDILKKTSSSEIAIIEEKEDFSSIINITIPTSELGKGYLNKRTLLSVSSCGICGKQKLEDISIEGNELKEQLTFRTSDIVKMFEDLKKCQLNFSKTGGSHAAGIFNINFEPLTCREDIGRHNAVDKCVGNLLQQNNLKLGKFLLVSGRVSYEIVSKAFIAGIPTVIAVSACSSLAIDFAKELGICLIGFTRDNKMTIYSNPNFIATSL